MRINEAIAKRSRPFLSFEFFPPKEKEAWPAFFATAGELKAASPLFASVTYGAGGSTQDNTLEIARGLKEQVGLEPLVHLTTVGASRERVKAFLARLGEAGVDNVLALRGDPPGGGCNFVPDNEEFQHASDLVTFIRKHFPQFAVGVAGYPRPHPESPSVREDLKWTRYKVDQGASFLVTQLFFDVRDYVDFVERLGEMGVDVPVIPGVLPIMSLGSLKFILSLCGASIPGNFYLDLEKADQEGGAEAVREIGVKYAIDQSRALIEAGAPGVHLYTLNKAEACLEIARGLADLYE